MESHENYRFDCKITDKLHNNQTYKDAELEQRILNKKFREQPNYETDSGICLSSRQEPTIGGRKARLGMFLFTCSIRSFVYPKLFSGLCVSVVVAAFNERPRPVFVLTKRPKERILFQQ